MDDVKNWVEKSAFSKKLGVQARSISEEGAELFLPFRDGNSNPGGALHGGVYASMSIISAHAAARTDQPVQQGMIAMLGTFIDTLIVCTMTGLVIVIMDVWPSGVSGASLTTMAFANAFPGGQCIVTLGLCLFAFTTMIGWSFYGERCVVFLFGTRAILPFRVAWVLAIPVGTVVELNMVWLIADTLNAFMAIPNLIALILLGPLVFRITREYFENIFIGH